MPTPDPVDFNTTDLEPTINAVIKESKAGYKTTEFWVSVVVSLLTVIDAYPVPEKAKGFIVGGIAVAYALSRGFAKQGVPAVDAEQPLPPA